jgi:SAM-dependent methyltransferase
MTEITREAWPSRSALLEMAGAFRVPCVLGAAAELDVWSVLGDDRLTAEEIAGRLDADLRATRMLLDALAALRVLAKSADRYSVPAELKPLLTAGMPQTALPMIHHGMNIHRNWAQLAWVVKAGIPAPRQASIRGFDADRAAFIAAMHVVSGPIAGDVVAQLAPLEFRHVLDVGGASGTWTIAFLRAVEGARATIFDLPDAIRQARDRFAGTDLADRVAFAAGDFYRDELPPGADFAWLSAIIHQHSREESRSLFAKIFRALEAGGRIGIRVIVMEPCRTRPVVGALFAINMLVNTDRGGTYTFAEIAEDLQAAGFRDPELKVRSDEMSSVVIARKPK